MSELCAILNLCKEYINDPQCVYKQCDGGYIVVMKKLPGTMMNEMRADIVDADRAKFRASMLEVMFIVNMNDTNDRPHQVLNRFHRYETMYTVGEKVVPHEYDQNIDTVCTGGIHYFKIIETAFTYGSTPCNFTGNWTSWYENGQKKVEESYVNGKSSGCWTFWYENGRPSSECEFIDGKESGKTIRWHENGQKGLDGNYVDGHASGKWTYWDDNGRKQLEGDYVDGHESGKWTYWHDNGQIKKEGSFANGKKTGTWAYWHNTGQKDYECNYVNGKQSGRWEYWSNATKN